MTDMWPSPPPAAPTETDPADPDGDTDEDTDAQANLAAELHGPNTHPNGATIWTGRALSEVPGDHEQAPDGWVNPPATPLHGSETPLGGTGIWTPRHGGSDSPYGTGTTEVTAPEGWQNPPARELHGSAIPAAAAPVAVGNSIN